MLPGHHLVCHVLYPSRRVILAELNLLSWREETVVGIERPLVSYTWLNGYLPGEIV
jgi:hypothetical protein